MTALLPALLLATAPAAVPAPAAAPASAPVSATATATASAPDDSVPHPLRLGFWSTSAFGVTHAKFFNQLVGARLDYRFTSRFAFGASLAYANLKGKDERVHNALPELSTEYRVPLHKDAYGMPIRLALGFLPKNGPTMSLGVGLDFAFSDTVSCEVVPFEAMVWVTRERPEVSLNGSLALRLAF